MSSAEEKAAKIKQFLVMIEKELVSKGSERRKRGMIEEKKRAICCPKKGRMSFQ